MTAEQYKNGAEIYQKIENLKGTIDLMSTEVGGVRITLPGLDWVDPKTVQDLQTYIDINRAAIYAEVLDILKDNLAKLEDELKQI